MTAVCAVLLAVPSPAHGQFEGDGPAAASGFADAESTSDDFVFPVTPGTVVRGFSPPPEPWLPGHRGVDLATTPGGEVRAAGPGRVAFAGMVAGRPVISIDHGGGIRTTYEPVHSDVIVGEVVAARQAIGRVLGIHPGCAATACVHWGARWSDDPDGYIDPLSLLGASSRPIVLKPVGDET